MDVSAVQLGRSQKTRVKPFAGRVARPLETTMTQYVMAVSGAGSKKNDRT
jgi:hypothetical protein